jgi:hypothetical protein
MTTYYVSPSGSDSNNGLGPDASHASNKPWLTIGKALGASGIASGDIVYVAPGTYREVVTVNMTSATAETQVIGDPANEKGFKNGSGVLLSSGEVQWTAFTTNDKTAPSGTSLLSLNAKDFLTFKNITLVTGAAHGITAAAVSTDIKFTDCTFIYGHTGASNFNVMSISGTFGVALNWTVDRCRFLVNGRTAINITLPTGSGSDYDANFLIRNCICITGSGAFVNVTSSGSSSQEGGGVDVLNCTVIGGGIALSTNTTRVGGSTFAFPCTMNNSFVYSATNGVNAGESGAITENYNLLYCGGTPRVNVTAGANSISDGSYASLVFVGQELQYGASLRPLGMPTPGSPLLGYGDDGNAPAVDILNRIRPSGGASASKAFGAYEFHNCWVKETSTVRTGSNALVCTGPGDHEFQVPVDATSTTISVYMRFDSTYSGTKPQLQIVNGTECGVSDATATCTGSANAWEQLSLNFTPTAKGIVTVRLVSNSTAASGKAFADDFAVT